MLTIGTIRNLFVNTGSQKDNVYVVNQYGKIIYNGRAEFIDVDIKNVNEGTICTGFASEYYDADDSILTGFFIYVEVA